MEVLPGVLQSVLVGDLGHRALRGQVEQDGQVGPQILGGPAGDPGDLGQVEHQPGAGGRDRGDDPRPARCPGH